MARRLPVPVHSGPFLYSGPQIILLISRRLYACVDGTDGRSRLAQPRETHREAGPRGRNAAEGLAGVRHRCAGPVDLHLPEEDETICNLYNQTTTQEAMRQLFKGLEMTDRAGNVAPGRVYPDQLAPIIRHDGEALELVKARWGMPSPPSVLKTARDPGVTNIRNLASPHWRRWLGPAHRCLVPVTAFAEPIKGGNQWFAPREADRQMFFAGIEVRGWKSLRKVKDGQTTDELYAFLTCAPNAEVAAVHPKAMPVILTTRGEWETWLSAPIEIAGKLQRPLQDGALALVDAADEWE